ncbi:MAG: SDR family NAD(P)-dependent oxidoreductase, partial [Paracoccaceae bacterium]
MSDTSKTAVVTGAARGIGRAIADRMANGGWQVVLADIDEPAAQDAAGALSKSGATALAHHVDVTDREGVAGMIDRAVGAFGRLDVLVSNAGIMDRAPFLEMTEEFWHHVIDTNLTGAFLCGQAAARQMIAQGTGGRIVNTASNSGIFGGRGRAAYGASKAGLINLTQTMAIELA